MNHHKTLAEIQAELLVWLQGGKVSKAANDKIIQLITEAAAKLASANVPAGLMPDTIASRMDCFDYMTRAGFKFDLINGRYYKV